MKIARFLSTALGALALCAALLAWVGYRVGTDLPPDDRGTGLTAATVLATDGMSPRGGRLREPQVLDRQVPDQQVLDRPSLDREALGRLARDASAAGKPAG